VTYLVWTESVCVKEMWLPKSLVTGGAGFIGSHLAEALVASGRRVHVIDDLSTGSLDNLEHVKDDPALSCTIADITNPSVLAEHVEWADEVYHLAAAVGVRLVVEDPVRTIETNIYPTEMLLRLANQSGKRVFLASTSEVYGKSDKQPLSEDDDMVLGPTTKGRWSYACSKAVDEFLAISYHRQHGLPVVVARLFNVVGPRQVGRYGMVVPRFVEQALAGGPIVVYDDGRQVRCFAHVSDVVGGIMGLMASEAALGGVFNLGSDRPVTIRELAELVRDQVDPPIEIKHIPYAQAYKEGFEDIRTRVPDLSKIRAAIGYEPKVTLEQILQDLTDRARTRTLEGDRT
jgi:nucleoside-diphosphate-sugar epimerase